MFSAGVLVSLTFHIIGRFSCSFFSFSLSAWLFRSAANLSRNHSGSAKEPAYHVHHLATRCSLLIMIFAGEFVLQLSIAHHSDSKEAWYKTSLGLCVGLVICFVIQYSHGQPHHPEDHVIKNSSSFRAVVWVRLHQGMALAVLCIAVGVSKIFDYGLLTFDPSTPEGKHIRLLDDDYVAFCFFWFDLVFLDMLFSFFFLLHGLGSQLNFIEILYYFHLNFLAGERSLRYTCLGCFFVQGMVTCMRILIKGLSLSLSLCLSVCLSLFLVLLHFVPPQNCVVV